MTKQTEVFNKYHRYEFAHGDDADFIAYQRRRGDGVCRRFQLDDPALTTPDGFREGFNPSWDPVTAPALPPHQ